MSCDQRLTSQTRNLFTALVKAQPILYNDVDRSQEAKDARDRIWNSIGQRIGIHGEVCKVKFTNMKNNYFSNLRKGYVNDSLKERLGFLDEFTPWNPPARIDGRRRTIRQSIYIPEDTDESLSDAEARNKPQVPDVQSTIPRRSVQKIRAIQQYAAEDEAKIKTTNVDSNSSVNESGLCAESDDFTIFFKNMEQTARKFDGLTQVKIKRMISDIIFDAEENWFNKRI